MPARRQRTLAERTLDIVASVGRQQLSPGQLGKMNGLGAPGTTVSKFAEVNGAVSEIIRIEAPSLGAFVKAGGTNGELVTKFADRAEWIATQYAVANNLYPIALAASNNFCKGDGSCLQFLRQMGFTILSNNTAINPFGK